MMFCDGDYVHPVRAIFLAAFTVHARKETGVVLTMASR